MFWGARIAHDGRSRMLSALCLACAAWGLLGAGGASAETISFTTAGCTTWTAPVGSQFAVQATGGAGSDGGFGGGAGGQADVASSALAGVATGTQLFVCVDVGGGAGGSSSLGQEFAGGAGGGASGVSLGADFSRPLLVAGGGGGGGGRSPYGLGEDPYGGGAAEQPGAGGAREYHPPYDEFDEYFGGGGGGASGAEAGAPGAAGVEGGAGSPGSPSTGSGPGAGGAGGFAEANCIPCWGGGGGGGGGGYYGGGGGGGGGIDGGGGGGGSSLVPAGGGVAPAAASAPAEVQITYTPGPAASTEAASDVTQTAATLNASVNPDKQEVTSCQFEYGPSESYGFFAPCEPSPGSGGGAVAVSARVTMLDPQSGYHYRVVAANESGTSYGEDETFETLPNPPTVTRLDPDAGPEAGGTPVTITGTGFEPTSTVEFGAVAAEHVTFESATTITALAPAEPAGSVHVVVGNPGGPSAKTAADEYTYVAPGPGPAIRSLSAKRGPAAGGTQVTITGSGFTGTTQVRIGASEATSFVLHSATSITAITPPSTTGSALVAVITPNGESGLTDKAVFTFERPTVTGLSAHGGPTGGGTSVTVTGSGFALGDATVVEFGRTRGRSVDCASSTTCTVLSPPAARAGAVNVTATVYGKRSKKRPPGDQFDYGPPSARRHSRRAGGHRRG